MSKEILFSLFLLVGCVNNTEEINSLAIRLYTSNILECESQIHVLHESVDHWSEKVGVDFHVDGCWHENYNENIFVYINEQEELIHNVNLVEGEIPVYLVDEIEIKFTDETLGGLGINEDCNQGIAIDRNKIRQGLLSHEIGHLFLGVGHTDNETNLMNNQPIDEWEITNEQIDIVQNNLDYYLYYCDLVTNK